MKKGNRGKREKGKGEKKDVKEGERDGWLKRDKGLVERERGRAGYPISYIYICSA